MREASLRGHSVRIEEDNNDFSFLIKKQITQIKSNTNNIKEEIKQNKKVMYNILNATTVIEKNIIEGKYDDMGD